MQGNVEFISKSADF